MHDLDGGALCAAGPLRVESSIGGYRLCAVIQHVDQARPPLLQVNPILVNGERSTAVLSWARRELASGARVAWLLADELDDLA